MAKRKTKEDYHKLAEKRGFKWVGGILPKNVVTKTLWQCSKEHKWEAKYNDICHNKSGCPYCSGKAKKLEQNYYNLAKSCNFKWVGKNLPKNTITKTLWECKKGHRWKARYNDIHQGNGCPYCAGTIKKTEKDYYKLAESRGFKWVGLEFPKNTQIKTLWKCKKKHTWLATFSRIQQNVGCPKCAGVAKKTKKDYHELAESCGFKWVSEVLPKSVMKKTLWKCSNNHCFSSRYSDVQQGYGCPYCYGNAKKTEKDYYDLANSRGFKWFGEKLPKNIHIKTQWGCEKGHMWLSMYSNIYSGDGCPYCKNIINGAVVSKPQIKLNNMLTGSLNYPEAKYRIDVAIMRRSQKIAVEYDAQYWHAGNEKYDTERDNYLISKGWKILHIKSGRLLPTRKKLNIAIKHLLETNKVTYNIYLKDWKH